MTTRTLSAGHSGYGLKLSSDDSLTILNGGVAKATVDGGLLTVNSGGMESGAIVNSNGSENVYGLATADTVHSGATETVESGGLLSGVSLDGGSLIVRSGGGVSHLLQNSGSATIYGLGNGLIINGGETDIYNSAADITVNHGGLAVIANAVNGITVNSGGAVFLESVTIGTGSGNLNSTGTLSNGLVKSGGTITGLELSSGSLSIGSSGFTLQGVNIQSGASVGLTVDFGTAVSGFLVSSGGSLLVDSGAQAENVTVYSGGVETVSGGGLIGNTNVESGGILSGLILNSGAIAAGNSPYVLDGVTINSGASIGLEVASGASISGFVVNEYGHETIASGGVATASIDNGGSLIVNAGGMESNAVLGRLVRNQAGLVSGNFGNENVAGQASGDTINNGGTETVESGGTANTLTVNSGGNLLVSYGGTASNITVDGGAVSGNGVMSGITINAGGTVNNLGSTSNIVVNSGGVDNINVGASNITINNGGLVDTSVSLDGITVNNGGVLQLADQAIRTIIGSPGSFIVPFGALSGGLVNSGGIISGLALTSGALVVGSGAIVLDGATIQSGASIGLTVDAGASVTGFVVSKGGYLTVETNAQAIDTTVASGGMENIIPGGLISNTTVDSGGLISGLQLSSGSLLLGAGAYVLDGVTIQPGAGVGLELLSGASTSGFVINSGGVETVDSGSVANATVVNNGGTEDIFGVAKTGVVYAGGNVLVESGAVANGLTVMSGGALQLMTGGVLHNVNIDSGGVITGLVVSKGDFSYNKAGFSLAGANIHSGVSVGFEVTSAATMHNLIVGSGGYEHIDSGSKAWNTTVNSGGAMVVSVGGVAYDTVIHGGSAELSGKLGVNQAVSMLGSGASLTLDNSAQYVGSISGFAGGDSITLNNVYITAVNWQNGVLAYSLDNGQTKQLALAGQYAGDSFAVSDEVNGLYAQITLLQPSLNSVAYNISNGLLTLGGSNLNGTIPNGVITQVGTYNAGDGSGTTTTTVFAAAAEASGLDGVRGGANGVAVEALSSSSSINNGGHITVTDFTLTVSNGSKYTLSSRSQVIVQADSSLSIQLSTKDQHAVDSLLTKAGNTATFSLSALSGWDTGASAVKAQLGTVEAVAVSHVEALGVELAAEIAVVGVFKNVYSVGDFSFS